MYSVEIAERLIADALRSRPDLTLDDLELHVSPDGSMCVMQRTKASRWLDWLSDNHGWGTNGPPA